jgi:uncharacterized protein
MTRFDQPRSSHMNSTDSSTLAPPDIPSRISEDHATVGFAGIGKLILAFVLVGVAVMVQQLIIMIGSLLAFTSTSTTSWELKHAEVFIDGERYGSLFELPTASLGMIWGSLAGIAILLIGGYFLGGRSWRAFNFRGFTWKSLMPWLVAIVAFMVIGHWVEQNYAQFQSKMMEGMILAGRSQPILMILGMGILAPIFEELIFRGVLFKYIANCWGGVVAVITTSLIFTVLHMQYNQYILAAVLVIAFILGMMRLRTGSIWPGIAVHCFNNTMSVLALLYFA